MPEPDDRYSDDDVEVAEKVEQSVRDPHHDQTTEREGVELALTDEDLSEAGEQLGDS